MGFDRKAVLGLTKEVTAENGEKKVLRLDIIDMTILRWISNLYPRMKKYTEDSNEYAWVSYKKLLKDEPLLRMCKKTLRRRFIKMTDLGVLTHKHLKVKGSFSYYGFGENYTKLLCKKNNANSVIDNLGENK